MILFVTGKPDSGKSRIAEDRAVQMAHGNLYYVATMKIYDEEGEKRVEKHRRQRAGKGFVTIECPFAVRQVLTAMKTPESSTLLLECIPNLIGNEMFENPERQMPDADGIERFLDPLYEELCEMAKAVDNLVIVSAEYDALCPEEKTGSDRETSIYIAAIEAMNRRLTLFADEVVRP